ncbi:MAG: hypothetical protein IT269_04190 [Saprospiraceae bacterium]|nr:hypothetical protein [Saprospiraceae bacterium]
MAIGCAFFTPAMLKSLADILEHTRIRQLLTLSFVITTVFCILPPDTPLGHWWSAQSVYIVLGTFILFLIFLIANKTRLMFVSLGCCAAICFYQIEVFQELGPKTMNEFRQIHVASDSILQHQR